MRVKAGSAFSQAFVDFAFSPAIHSTRPAPPCGKSQRLVLLSGSILMLPSLLIREEAIKMKKLRPTAGTARYCTLRFTQAEKARIDKAARISGAINGRSAIWARFMLLDFVSDILKSDREPTAGARLRQRLHYFQHDSSS